METGFDSKLEFWEIVGNRLLEDTTEPCAPGPKKRNNDPTGDLTVGIQESPVKQWVSAGLLQGWGHGL